MLCLSVRQPWAWLIVAGHKDVENRAWRTDRRERIQIHASSGITEREYDECRLFAKDNGVIIPAWASLVRGAVIGEATIVDCVGRSDSPWFAGPWGFVLEHAYQYATPLPGPGRLGLFTFGEVRP